MRGNKKKMMGKDESRREEANKSRDDGKGRRRNERRE